MLRHQNHKKTIGLKSTLDGGVGKKCKTATGAAPIQKRSKQNKVEKKGWQTIN